MKMLLSLRELLSMATLLLLWSTLFLVIKSPFGYSEPDTIYVPDDHERIQWAIGNATAGDTIFIHNGTYYEHLTVNKPLTLAGENSETTIIDGSGEPRTIIGITAGNVVVRALTVRNCSTAGTYAAIKVSGYSCYITGCVVTKAFWGIFVTSQSSIIAENVAGGNSHGISLYSSSNTTVEANNTTRNTVGISLALSFNNTVQHNRALNSSLGGHGIILSQDSHDNIIIENGLVGNYHGMWLSGSYGNSIVNNTIANNKLLGIELATSSNNKFYHNNFVNNPKHIVIDNGSIDTWNHSYPSGGNYWHGYAGIDEKSGPNQDKPGSDQIWDNPYIINANNRDDYPSMTPYSNITGLLPDEESQNGQDNRPIQIDTSSILISALAGLIVVVMVTAVFWKRSAKSRKRKARTMIRK
jgi:parallel beta-helix repeat protein